jgi:nucleoside-diphosphate-sugar epimerase
VTSFIHLNDAVAATVLALEYDGSGLFNIVDDEPAPVHDGLPVMAQALGAKPPRHFPRWLARLFAGEAAVMMGTESRGAPNAKAKRELGWAGHDNKTARTVAVYEGETLNAPALRAMFEQIIANNRAGGWRRLKEQP